MPRFRRESRREDPLEPRTVNSMKIQLHPSIETTATARIDHLAISEHSTHLRPRCLAKSKTSRPSSRSAAAKMPPVCSHHPFQENSRERQGRGEERGQRYKRLMAYTSSCARKEEPNRQLDTDQVQGAMQALLVHARVEGLGQGG